MTLTVPPDASAAAGTTPPLIRVLFADDSPAMRSLARVLLTPGKGFSLTSASDGAEALALFDAHRPHCVVLDIDMPGVDGLQALDVLQRRHPEVPVVMLSGFSSPVLTRKAKARGAAAYLEKSSEMTRLADTVRRVSSPVGGASPEPAPPAPPPRTAESPEPDGPPGAPPALPGTDDSTTAAELRRLEQVISHDFAEPVRVMGGFAALLEQRHAADLDASGHEFLAHLVQGARRMQAMVDDLLVFSRAGRAVAHLEQVDVAGLVVDVIADLAPLAAERRATVAAGPLPSAWADATMTRTVLQQVLANALTFSTVVHPTVEIAGGVVGTSTVLTVTDNGIGVSPEHTEAVFELFRRLHTRDEYAGTGTGLALCRRLLGLQSGTITLGPAAAGGTVVTIVLPTRPPSTDPSEDQP